MSSQQQAVDFDTLKGLEPIKSLSPERIRQLAQKTFIESFEPDVTLFREGDTDHRLVYLLEGEIMLQSSFNQHPTHITAGMPESWHPIANRFPRQTTATTASPVELIRIDIDEFDRMLAWDQMSAAEADGGATSGSSSTPANSNWSGNLHQSLAFQRLPPANIEELFRRMEPVAAKAGDVIIRQGDSGDYYYVLEEGSAKVTRQMAPGAPPVELAVLGAGVSFGEEALISDNPRNATITMVTDGRLLRLGKKDFAELLQEPMLEWVSFDEVLERLDDQTEFLDVRVPAEYSQGHLPNSINIPLFELRPRMGELQPDIHYICYCSTGRRSSAASFVLTQSGIKASVLRDGLLKVPASFVIRQA